MEKWAKERPRRGHQNPSFSSTLLDAIFRSIDECDAGGGRPDLAPTASAEWGAATVAPPFSFRRDFSPSSSNSSSLGGFSFSSSSDPGSAGSHRARSRPIRTAAAAARPLPPLRAASSPPSYHRIRTKASPIRIKARDPRRAWPPVSPGARFAGFLSSLFAMATGKPRKPKTAPGNASCSMAVAANYSGPCLLKTSSSSRRQAAEGEGLKRSVRFHLAANAVDEQSVQEGDRRRTKEGKRRKREEMRRRVEELLRGLEEEEEEDMMSDSSSDLFELENLMADGGGVYMDDDDDDDELPVYSSTHLSTNRAISAVLRL